MTRRLTVKRETLTELTSTELGVVAGGQDFATVPCLTGHYPTINYNCTRLVGDLLTGTTTTS